jgi:hypothetical protein
MDCCVCMRILFITIVSCDCHLFTFMTINKLNLFIVYGFSYSLVYSLSWMHTRIFAISFTVITNWNTWIWRNVYQIDGPALFGKLECITRLLVSVVHHFLIDISSPVSRTARRIEWRLTLLILCLLHNNKCLAQLSSAFYRPTNNAKECRLSLIIKIYKSFGQVLKILHGRGKIDVAL